VAQRVGRGIALLFHDRDTRRGSVVSKTPRPHFTPRKDPVPILQEAGWAPGPVWMGGKTRPHQDSIPDRPGRSLFAITTELPGPLIYIYIHTYIHTYIYIYMCVCVCVCFGPIRFVYYLIKRQFFLFLFRNSAAILQSTPI